MGSNPKEVSVENEGIDRISELPDPILSIILCNLPTKNAVGTSILSTRWKNLFPFWFTPVKLDFDDSVLLNPRLNNNPNFTPWVSFIHFVDRLLNETLSGMHSVEEMILHCDKQYGDHKVGSWVCAALRLNVRHLNLKFSRYESTEAFSHSLNGCTTLVTLRLWVKHTLHLPQDFSLPNLKTLNLCKLTFTNEQEDYPVEQLMEGCPALEYLSFFLCTFWYDISIPHPLLKTLVLEGCWKDTVSYSLTLDTPNLEELTYDGFLADGYYGGDLKCLHTVLIDIRPSEVLLDFIDENHDDQYLLGLNNSIAMFVSRCSSTISLTLSDCTIDGFQENEERFADFKNLLPIRPECLVVNMKTIEFLVFEEHEDEIKLVEYFLKNGECLLKLILHFVPPKDQIIFTRLLMLARQSKTCQIECRAIQQFNPAL